MFQRHPPRGWRTSVASTHAGAPCWLVTVGPQSPDNWDTACLTVRPDASQSTPEAHTKGSPPGCIPGRRLRPPRPPSAPPQVHLGHWGWGEGGTRGHRQTTRAARRPDRPIHPPCCSADHLLALGLPCPPLPPTLVNDGGVRFPWFFQGLQAPSVLTTHPRARCVAGGCWARAQPKRYARCHGGLSEWPFTLVFITFPAPWHR